MSCPNCGAETNEAVCPVCGMNLQQNAYPEQGMSMQQGAFVEQGMSMQQGAFVEQGMNMQQNVYPGPDMNGAYQQPMDYQGTVPQKSHKGKVIGIIIAGAVVIAAVVVIFAICNLFGAGRGKKVVKNFFEAMNDGDTDEIIGCFDPAVVDYEDSDLQSIIYTFSYWEVWGVELYVDYDIVSHEKADMDVIEEMCEEIYGDVSVADDVSKAYIYEVDYTSEMTYDGESIEGEDPEEYTMNLFVYKMDGEWYLGGIME